MNWNTISQLLSLIIISVAFLVYAVGIVNPKYVASYSDTFTKTDISGGESTKTEILYGVPMFIMIIGLINESIRHYDLSC